jgi:hypothetical protein
MKLKDYFKRLKDTGKITEAEFDAFLESIPEHEMPDALLPVIESKFMTLDRAASHPEVNKKLRAELLDPVDEVVRKVFDKSLKELVGPEHAHIINSEKNTYKKLEALENLITTAVTKAKSSTTTDEDTKKELNNLKELKSELLKKLEDAQNGFVAKENELKSNYEKQLKDYQLGGELEKMSNSYILADAFEPKRSAITKVILAELKSKHKFSLGEKDGQTEIQVTDENGKPIFPNNGNVQLTAKSLLDEAFKDYVKQSDGSQGQQRQNQDTQPKKFDVSNNGKQGRSGVRTTLVQE